MKSEILKSEERKMKKILSIILVLVLVTASTTLPAAAEEKMDEVHTVSFEYAPLTDSERNEFIREEMEKLLGSDADYRMYFGNEEENLIVPLNDIDEYKTEWSPKKSVDVSGTPGGVLKALLSVSGSGNQTYYLGWTYTDEGGPSVEKGISFFSPFKYINVSFSLGMVSNSDKYGIEFGIYDAKPGVKYKVTKVTKTYDVQQYIIYKKKYNDAGTYSWEEWSGGNSTKLTNRDFTIKRV